MNRLERRKLVAYDFSSTVVVVLAQTLGSCPLFTSFVPTMRYARGTVACRRRVRAAGEYVQPVTTRWIEFATCSRIILEIV
jgi:hypothetical protein